MPDYVCDQITIDDLATLRQAAFVEGVNRVYLRWHIFAPAILELIGMTVANPFISSGGIVLDSAFGNPVDAANLLRLAGHPVVIYREGEFGGWQGNVLALEEVRHGIFFTLYADRRVVTWRTTRTIPNLTTPGRSPIVP